LDSILINVLVNIEIVFFILDSAFLEDHYEAEALGFGFSRTQALGLGAPLCDHRFIKNKKTPQLGFLTIYKIIIPIIGIQYRGKPYIFDILKTIYYLLLI
jgi:hypothetical protein